MDIGQTPEKAQREGKTRSSGIEKEVRAMGMQQNGPTQDVQTSVFITASRAASPALDPRWEWPWRRESVWCARFLSLRVRTMTMWSLLTSCPNKCWGRRSPPQNHLIGPVGSVRLRRRSWEKDPHWAGPVSRTGLSTTISTPSCLSFPLSALQRSKKRKEKKGNEGLTSFQGL